MISYRATFTYVLNSATLESQLGGSFDRGPVDVRGLVAYTYLVPRRSSDHPGYLPQRFNGQLRPRLYRVKLVTAPHHTF